MINKTEVRTHTDEWLNAIAQKSKGIVVTQEPEVRTHTDKWYKAIYDASNSSILESDNNFTGNNTMWNLQVNNYFQTGGVVGTIYVQAPKVEATGTLLVGKMDVAKEIEAIKAHLGI